MSIAFGRERVDTVRDAADGDWGDAKHAGESPDRVFATYSHVVVRDEDADPKVALIVAVGPNGGVELEVLPGSVESNADLLTPA